MTFLNRKFLLGICACGCKTTIPIKSKKWTLQIFAHGHGTRIRDERICVNCKTNETSVESDGYKHWFRHKDGFLCKKCYHKLVTNPKWQPIWNPINNPKRFMFKGEFIFLDHNPRKGICSNCGRTVKSGEIKVTNLHHYQYHDNEPLKDTIELCVRCHRKMHKK